jgi:hypothetical protein
MGRSWRNLEAAVTQKMEKSDGRNGQKLEKSGGGNNTKDGKI